MGDKKETTEPKIIGYTTCPNCGIDFGSSIIEMRRKDGLDFYCPNGHSLCYLAAREAKEKAEKEKIRAERETEELERIFNTPAEPKNLAHSKKRIWF